MSLPDLRPATANETEAYLSGHQTFPGAVETEDGLMVPDETLLNPVSATERLIYDALTHMAPGDALDIVAHDLAQAIAGRVQPEHYTLHYVSTDGPGDTATWSVYREQYVSPEAEEPIDGTQEHVSQHATEAEAHAEAVRLQGIANGGAL